MGRWKFLVALLVVLSARPVLSQNATTGAIRGRTVDALGQPLENATVNVYGERGTQTITTAADGSFVIGGLLPGDYSLELLRPFRGRLDDRVVALQVHVDASRSTQVIFGKDGVTTSSLDPVSASLQHVVDARYLDLPLPNRYTEGLASFTPTARNDGKGIAFGDTTSYDNRFILDGLDTTYAGTGLGGTGLPVELLDQTVTTYGGAQLGRSLGAQVLSVLPSGTNQSRVTVFARYFGAPTRGAARVAEGSADALRESSDLAGSYQLGASYSGPIVRDHAWFFVGASTQLTHTTYSLTLRSEQDCLAAGGSVCEAQFANGLPDLDSRGKPLWHRVSEESRTGTDLYTPLVARVDEAVGQQQGSLSLIAVPGHTTSPVIDSEESTARQSSALSLDLVGHWKTQLGASAALEISAGWHRASVTEDAQNDAGKKLAQHSFFATSFGQYAEHQLVNDYAVAQCHDGGTDDLYPFITNCPLQRDLRSGGVGSRERFLDERQFVSASLSRRVVAAGVHELRATASLSRERNEISEVLSGGHVIYDNDRGVPSSSSRLVRLPSPGDSSSLYDSDCLVSGGTHSPCRIIGDELGESDSLYAARARLFGEEVADLWMPIPQVAITGALRFDSEHVGSLDLHGYWAPRLGVVVTPTDDGRTKLFAQFARSTELLPITSVTHGTPISVMNDNITDSVGVVAFDPNLRAGSRDEWIGGAAHQLEFGPVLQVSWMHRRVRRAIDDIVVSTGSGASTTDPTSPDFTGNVIANPGEGLAADRERARRTYDAVTITASQRVSDRLFLEAAYTRSRTRGNYPGVVDEATGQVAAFHGLYQFDNVNQSNIDGVLGQDRPDRLELDSAYLQPLGDKTSLVVGASFVAVSGSPRVALDGQADWLLPVGALGRAELAHELDLHLGVRRALSPKVGGELYVDLFNVYDKRGASMLDTNYVTASSDNVRPIDGGSAEDLVWLKEVVPGTNGAVNVTPAARNPDYGTAAAYYAPISATVGARVTF